jgi:hypothetical protein
LGENGDYFSYENKAGSVSDVPYQILAWEIVGIIIQLKFILQEGTDTERL